MIKFTLRHSQARVRFALRPYIWDFARVRSTINFIREVWHTRIDFAYN